MRIISKYKDYYDNAMSFGIDTTQVFVRHEEFVEVPISKAIERLLDSLRYSGAGTFFLKSKRKQEFKVDLDYIQLGFCGEHILGLRFKTLQDSDVLNCETYYSQKQVQKGFEKVLSTYNLDLPKGHESHSIERTVSRFATKKNQLEELGRSQFFQSIFIANNCPAFIFNASTSHPDKLHDHFDRKYYRSFGKHIILTNPCLKEVDFYRHMNAFECYQKINQYKFGVLANNEDGHSAQSDIEKVQSHGFDMKYGFRKRPNGPKK